MVSLPGPPPFHRHAPLQPGWPLKDRKTHAEPTPNRTARPEGPQRGRGGEGGGLRSGHPEAETPGRNNRRPAFLTGRPRCGEDGAGRQMAPCRLSGLRPVTRCPARPPAAEPGQRLRSPGNRAPGWPGPCSPSRPRMLRFASPQLVSPQELPADARSQVLVPSALALAAQPLPAGPSPGGLGLRWCGAKRPALELGFSRSTASFPLIPGR